MKKTFAFFLMIVLVMSLVLPAYAVGSPRPDPYHPIGDVRCKCAMVLWRDRDMLPAEAKANFEAAKESAKDAVPEGFACRDLVYSRGCEKCTTCEIALVLSGAAAEGADIEWKKTSVDNACGAYEVEMSMDGVTGVVVKQYLRGEWVELEVSVEGNVILMKGAVDGPMAIFMK